MHTLDWLIVAVPILVVLAVGLKAQRYVKGVSDFLAAGRVAGRYVLAVSAGEASFGLISAAAGFEFFYKAGFAISFWNLMYIPISMILTLSGYCIYRFRETRAMTMGQFLEMRYNRAFRVVAGSLQSLSGVLNYAIFPAVSARFLIYFCDLPLEVNLLGMALPTFGLLMAFFLGLAVFIVCLGGQITIIVTDCIQGILSYPFYAIVVTFLIVKYSYFGDIAPSLLDRPPGESMVNPFDIAKLRDFNIFYVIVGILNSTVNRMSWSGTQGYNAAAINAHEQKMGGVLGTWRAGFSTMMFILLSVTAVAFLNNPRFRDEALPVRRELAAKTLQDVVVPRGEAEAELAGELQGYLETGELSLSLQARVDDAAQEADPEARPDEPVHGVVKKVLTTKDASAAQSFNTIFGQMRVPSALKAMMPTGIMGVFCALCIFLMISTDTTYMHSWGSIIVQDIIMPIHGKALTPRQHLRLLRFSIAGVAVFAFIFSFFFSQVDYIFMFFAITGAIWTGGAGPCIVGGLYWKRATTAGAFTTLIAGSSVAVGGMILQKIWAPTIYPWLEAKGYLPGFARFLEACSRPLEPIVVWRVTPDKFPINSQEILFFGLLISLTLFVGVSLLTCREPYNMDRLLHRGKYRREGEEVERPEKFSLKVIGQKLVGINSEYTLGDRFLAWSAFGYGVFWVFGSFLVIVTWNAMQPWPDAWWVRWWALDKILIAGLIGLVSTFWFSIGGSIDLRRLFKRLGVKETNVLDDGRVVGNVSADDVAMVEEVEHVRLRGAHREEAAHEDEHDTEAQRSRRDRTQ